MHSRLVKIIFIFVVMLIHTAIAQDTYIGEKSIDIKDSSDSVSDHIFYKVNNKRQINIFKKAVTDHIVKNKGIQDFYEVYTVFLKS